MNKKLLKEVLAVQTHSKDEDRMIEYIEKWCIDNNYRYETVNRNVYVTKGKSDLYPTYVAHTDTVHKIIKGDLHIVEYGGVLIALNEECIQTGIGGDDKVGIYVAMQMLKRLKHCKVAFFHSEEIGCIGSKDANIEFFKDSSFILQADRRGNDDVVTSIYGKALSSKAFKKQLLKYCRMRGYKEANGAMTDVQALNDKNVGVSCANFSCGYYRPHSTTEVVSLSDVENVEELFYEIANGMGFKQWKHSNPIKVVDIETINNDWVEYYRTRYADTQIDMFESSEYESNNNTDWYKDDKHGLVRETNFYCKKCIDVEVNEKHGNRYFRYYCPSCGTLHDVDDVLTLEQAINIMSFESEKRSNID